MGPCVRAAFLVYLIKVDRLLLLHNCANLPVRIYWRLSFVTSSLGVLPQDGAAHCRRAKNKSVIFKGSHSSTVRGRTSLSTFLCAWRSSLGLTTLHASENP